MKKKLPGTQIDHEPGYEKNAFAVFAPMLSITGGLTLSQVCAVTGLPGSTVQNWIKRGWVAKTSGKKYCERQLMRIVIINMLKNCMKLDDIVRLMAYVNGSVEDEGDDIIPDRELYNIVTYVVFSAGDEGFFNRDRIMGLIDSRVDGFALPEANAARLKKAVLIMSLAYISSVLQDDVERLLADV